MVSKFKGLARWDIKEGRDDKELKQAWAHRYLDIGWVNGFNCNIPVSIQFMGSQLFGDINIIGTDEKLGN